MENLSDKVYSGISLMQVLNVFGDNRSKDKYLAATS